jgi:MFS transporter, DHA2 family, methylenomycin A resistance protein
VTKRIATSVPLAVVLLDVTAVAVLLPDIRLDLGSSTLGALCVLNAYLLTLAALLPVFSHLRGRALTIGGGLVMAAAAVLCARADSTTLLVAGRAVQGAGAAAVLSSVTLDAARGRALAAVLLPAIALALGPLVGGVFAQQNWWRVFFWAGVAVAAVACVAALPTATDGRRPGMPPASARLLVLAAGAAALAIVLVQIDVSTWGFWAMLFVAGVVYLRWGPLSQVPGTPWAWGVVSGCVAGLLFVMPQYFQLARNLSGVRSGTLLLTVTVPAVIAWALAPWLARRVPPIALTLAGFASAGAALAVLTAIEPHSRYALLIGLLGVAGAGLGAAGGTVASVPGLEWRSNAVMPALAGAALGLAVVGAAFESGVDAERGRGTSFEQALSFGAGSAAFVLALLVAAGALALWQPRRAPTPASSEAHPAAGS